MKYLLIDTANMFFRARHVAFRATDPLGKSWLCTAHKHGSYQQGGKKV